MNEANMVKSLNSWRIVYSEAANGAWNMAIDEAILESAGNGLAPPTLRLYAWEPACLSLGMAQPSSEVNYTALAQRGWQAVRRPTGGRAILHTDELTYSICGLQTEPCLAGGVLESYRVIAAALLEALRLLGVAATADEIPGSRRSSPDGEQSKVGKEIDPVCFTEPSNYEITAGGKKLIGSAQARRGNAVLQHGSLPLTGDLRRIVQVLNYPNMTARQAAAIRITDRATTVEQLLGKKVSWEDAAVAMRRAFEGRLGLDLATGDLSAAEINRAAELEAQKYDNLEWTARI
jgi:lipoate-protein ligase A